MFFTELKEFLNEYALRLYATFYFRMFTWVARQLIKVYKRNE